MTDSQPAQPDQIRSAIPTEAILCMASLATLKRWANILQQPWRAQGAGRM
jgi:hypothetical protein